MLVKPVAVGAPTRRQIWIKRGPEYYHLCFSVRTTRQALREAMMRFGPEIIKLTGMSETDEFVWNAMLQCYILNGWRIGFSSSTERDLVGCDVKTLSSEGV